MVSLAPSLATTRDVCLFGCGVQGECLAHYLRQRIRMAIGIFDVIGDSTHVSDAASAFQRLILATLAYHAVRAYLRQHRVPSAARATDILQSTVAPISEPKVSRKSMDPFETGFLARCFLRA